MRFITAVHSDIGIEKKVNQDSVLMRTGVAEGTGEIAFCVVCDGMGGLSKGELASATVLEAFSAWFDEGLPLLLGRVFTHADIERDWQHIVQEQNRKIMEYGRAKGVNLGTTLVALLMVGNRYYAVNVGDSRLYAVREALVQLSVDHTLVNREVMLGHITPEEALVHPQRNVLLQCIGASQRVVPDFFTGELLAQTVFVLCSDGFRHEITPREFYNSFSPKKINSEQDAQGAAVFLTELNKQRQERDNITVAVIKVC